MSEPAASAGLCLVNVCWRDGTPGTVRIQGSRIAAVNLPPHRDDRIVDARGDRVLPGLVNAHDHLQLNALPRLKSRAVHANATEWIDDMRPRLADDPMLRANAAIPREQRLLIGGLKNLLSGVTTVAHHDPLFPPLLDAGFPVRVLERAGWSHSLALDGDHAVRRSHAATPEGQPWIIHAAEGVDAAAAAEFDRLESLGCISAKTRLVHGLALSSAQQQRLVGAGAALIWCPGSNLHLFGCTPDVRWLHAQGRLLLGSDSRISGSSDLLAELRVASAACGLDDDALESLVTHRAAELLSLPDRGVLAPGRVADLIVIPAGRSLVQISRTNIRLVMLGGRAQLADDDMAHALGDAATLVPVTLDGQSRHLARPVVRGLAASQIGEPGLEIDAMAQALSA